MKIQGAGDLAGLRARFMADVAPDRFRRLLRKLVRYDSRHRKEKP